MSVKLGESFVNFRQIEGRQFYGEKREEYYALADDTTTPGKLDVTVSDAVGIEKQYEAVAYTVIDLICEKLGITEAQLQARLASRDSLASRHGLKSKSSLFIFGVPMIDLE